MRSLRAALRSFGAALTTDQVNTFVEVALHPGITILALSEQMGYQQSTATRNADILGSYGRGGRKGLGLIERREVPGDRRMRELHLTARGHRVSQTVTEAMT